MSIPGMRIQAWGWSKQHGQPLCSCLSRSSVTFTVAEHAGMRIQRWTWLSMRQSGRACRCWWLLLYSPHTRTLQSAASSSGWRDCGIHRESSEPRQVLLALILHTLLGVLLLVLLYVTFRYLGLHTPAASALECIIVSREGTFAAGSCSYWMLSFCLWVSAWPAMHAP